MKSEVRYCLQCAQHYKWRFDLDEDETDFGKCGICTRRAELVTGLWDDTASDMGEMIPIPGKKRRLVEEQAMERKMTSVRKRVQSRYHDDY